MLTPKQRAVAEHLARGMSYKDIGRALHISPETVRDHVQEAARRINPQATTRPRDTVQLWFVTLDRDAA